MTTPYPHHDFPALAARHLRNARLYGDKLDLLRAIALAPGSVIGEVGVAAGWLSTFMIDLFQPAEFVAFDTFILHTIPTVWGLQTLELFEGKTHLDFYRDKYAGSRCKVVTEEGWSHETLPKYPDDYFDLLYIDAGHTYKEVKRDSDIAKTKLKTHGLMVFNDYIMFDHLTGGPYGVVPAVNELVVQEDWEVVGFALQQQMVCDIAIRRMAPG
jgi:hypothetical protein